MIDKLTKENLQNLGFKENDVNELYNTTEPYNLQCNEGNIFVSKTENKLYTGVDMYRKIYFTEKNINFPFKCPDLFDEYFELSLAKFFDNQKAQLSIHFDEKTQFGKFIQLETKRSEESIKENKEYIKTHSNTRWFRKERAVNVLETYIQFLDNKLFVNRRTNTEKPEKKLPVNQIALKYAYEGIYITPENMDEEAKKYGWTSKRSGKGLYDDFLFYIVVKNRTDNPNEGETSNIKLKNKIKLFEAVFKLLPEGKRNIAFGEIGKLKGYLSNY